MPTRNIFDGLHRGLQTSPFRLFLAIVLRLFVIFIALPIRGLRWLGLLRKGGKRR